MCFINLPQLRNLKRSSQAKRIRINSGDLLSYFGVDYLMWMTDDEADPEYM